MLAVTAALITVLGGLPATAQTRTEALTAGSTRALTLAPAEPEVREAVKHDLSGKLRDLVVSAERRAPKAKVEDSATARRLPRKAEGKAKAGSEAVQKTVSAQQMPEFLADFEGVGNVNGVLPPDTTGDVGPNHYVQMVNLAYAVYDKRGALLLGPLDTNTIWSGFGGPCETTNDGDPIVAYDEAADRWLLSQFAVPGGSVGYHQCVAISQTPDPTGAFYRYDFFYHQSRMNDYPKFGIWPDGYYMSTNEFGPSFVGAGAVAFERDKMLAGEPARMVYFHLGPDFGGLLPADPEGAAPPPGAPMPFVMFDDDAWGISPTDRLLMWDFKVDWSNPAGSTFGDDLAPSRVLETEPFDSDMCNYTRPCIPQPGSTARLDAIADRLMFRAAYRNFGDHASLVLNHTVDVDGADHAGVRWYELRTTASGWNIHQQGTYAPDADHRWMASAAIDVAGNIAIGYSVSGATTAPSIRVAGRLSGDPLGELGQSERTMIAGSGAQTHPAARWGDYSTMSVDPADGCTFWFTSEYVSSVSSADWHTRIGSVKFPNCVAGPSGQVTGKVTAAGGGPIAGASIRVGGSGTVTGEDGSYRISLPVGEHEVTASAFGYTPKTVTVNVTEGGTVTADFALTALPRRRVSGVVKDGSGHGWPLYARIDVAGRPGGPVFTDPATGAYSVELPPGEYGLAVKAMYPSYQQLTQPLTVGEQDQVKDIALPVDASCAAAGYRFSYGEPLFTQRFETGTTPEGWTVENRTPSGGWVFDDPSDRGNLTGGSGGYAIADSDAPGFGTTVDTDLVTPPLDLTSVPKPVLRFNSDYRALNGFANVELSVDGGATYTTVSSWTTASRRGPVVEEIPIPDAAGKADVRLRFHYRGSYAWWWEIDDVSVLSRSCDPVPGGLVVGRVLDGNTGDGVNDATVTSVDKPAEKTTTAAVPDDEALGDGFYRLFSSLTGKHPFTAEKSGYERATARVSVTADQVTRQNLTLGAGRVVVEPGEVTADLTLGKTKSMTTTFRNTGNATVKVNLTERRGSFDLLGKRGAPLRLHMTKGFSNPAGWLGDRKPGVRPDPEPYAPPWTNTANYPIPIMDNATAVYDGKVYSVGGVTGTTIVATSYVYDPPANTWTRIPDLPAALEAPAAAFIGDRLYVLGGWTATGGLSDRVYVYDTDAGAWETTQARHPAPAAGSGVAVVDGRIYLVGGCADDACARSDVTVVYDPGADAFTELAPYPVPVAWQGCGGIGATVYCAGGTGSAALRSAFAYNPAADSWSPIADMPFDLWASAVDVANGMLLLSSGLTNNSTTITNQGFAYDPAADAWQELPNANFARYRSAGACGFVKIGGSTGGFTPTPDSELLPGFDQCGTTAVDVPWLKASPATFTLRPGRRTSVSITLKALESAGVSQPGTYTAQFGVRSGSPYRVKPIDVTMNVKPPADWGKLAGTVTGTDCRNNPVTLRGATVQVNGQRKWTFTLKTDTEGKYQIWGPKKANPVRIIVARDGWVPAAAKAEIRAGRTVTTDFHLRPICG